jgi:hypothetical protein
MGIRAKQSLEEKETPPSSLEQKYAYWRYYLPRVKIDARKRNIEFNITLENIFAPDFCPIFNTKLNYSGKPNAPEEKPSLDRIDNTKGYIPGNIMVISWRANKLKADATLEQLYKAALFWKNYYEAGQAIPEDILGEPLVGVGLVTESVYNHEVKKAYWRDYQRKRAAEKKAALPGERKVRKSVLGEGLNEEIG